MTHPWTGEKVLLRPFLPEDLDGLVAYLNLPGLDGRRYAPGQLPDLPVTPAAGKEILERWSRTDNEIHLAVEALDGGHLAGHVNAYWGWDPHCPDVQVVISPQYQRRGFGAEALRLLVSWIFAGLPAHSLSTFVAGWNDEGRRFIEKQGFRLAGISRRESIWRGACVDEYVYDLLRREWEALHGA